MLQLSFFLSICFVCVLFRLWIHSNLKLLPGGILTELLKRIKSQKLERIRLEETRKTKKKISDPRKIFLDKFFFIKIFHPKPQQKWEHVDNVKNPGWYQIEPKAPDRQAAERIEESGTERLSKGTPIKIVFFLSFFAQFTLESHVTRVSTQPYRDLRKERWREREREKKSIPIWRKKEKSYFFLFRDFKLKK